MKKLFKLANKFAQEINEHLSEEEASMLSAILSTYAEFAPISEHEQTQLMRIVHKLPKAIEFNKLFESTAEARTVTKALIHYMKMVFLDKNESEFIQKLVNKLIKWSD